MVEGTTSSDGQKWQRLRDYQRSLEAFSRIGAEKLPPERLMHHVVAQVSRVTQIARTKIMRYRIEKGDLLVVAGVGWKDGVVGNTTLAVDHGSPAGHAMQTAAPVMIADITRSEEYRYPEMLRDHGIVSLLNVPIMINGQTWGVLEVDSARPMAFDEWDVSYLSIVANILGACLAYHEAEEKNIEAAGQVARAHEKFDVILRELQHRIKNNLQIIIAFLSLKRRDSKSEETREKLESVMARVQAIALAHDLLSAGHDSSSVDFAQYLHSLCANIDPPRPSIDIEVQADAAQIPIDRAVPVGLIVNELVTNSIKYAFGNNGGNIRVNFSVISHASEGCVCVEDDGKGLGAPSKKGLGLNLVERLAQQIQGRVDYPKVETGTRITVCFPVAL
jgi:two-component sensor histidine kinase